VAADGNGDYVVTWSAAGGNQPRQVLVLRVSATGEILPSGRNPYAPGSVSGRRFDDANANGVQDAGEAGLAGVEVFLDSNANGLRDAGELSQPTNAQGDYSFSGVPTGVYQVRQVGGGPSGPASVGDDFNRADGTDLGNLWTEPVGDFRIENNRLRSGAYTNAMAVYQGFSGTEQAVTVDVIHHSQKTYAEAAIALAYADPQHYVSVRFSDYHSSDDLLQYNRLYFEDQRPGMGEPWSRMKGGQTYYDWGVEIAPFASARILAVYDPAAAVVTVGIDRNFDGVYETVISRGGAPVTGLGTQVALSGYNGEIFDNFTVNPSVVVVPAAAVTPSEEFPVAPEQRVPQSSPAIGAAGDGRFAVVWQANAPDGTGTNVYVQRFGPDAEALGPVVRTHAFVAGEQRDADIKMKDNGEFVAVWTSRGQDGDGYGVYAQQYDAAGNPASLEEFRVNTTTTNDQWWPAIAGDGQSRFALTWVSYSQDGWDNGIIGTFLTLATPTPRALLGLTAPDVTGSPALDFGQVLSGSNSPSRTLRVTNLGTANLTGTVTLSGSDAARFPLTGNPSFNLAPGAFYDYQIEAATDVRGTFASQLVVESNADTTATVVPITSAVVPAVDAREPNNNRDTATALGAIATLTLNDLSLHDGLDQDWYHFTVAQTTVLQLRAPHQYSEGDLDMVLYGADGRPIDASSTQTDEERVAVLAQPGQSYYLRVFSTGPAANVYDMTITEYRLSVSLDRASIVENQGAAAAVGTVTRHTADASTALTVTLASQDTSELKVPKTVLIPANELSASFPIDAVDDILLDETQTVAITASADGYAAGSETIEVIDHEPPRIKQMRRTSSGLVVETSFELDATDFNLYDQGNLFGAPDVTLVGAVTGPVRISAVISPDGRRISLIRTAGLLPPDEYTLTLVSGATAVRDTAGVVLDGNADGVPGANYVTKFVVPPPLANAIIVSLPNVTRGFGQPVNLPANNPAAGLPLTISNGLGVSRVELQLRYDPALLNVSDFVLNSAVGSRGAARVLDTSTPGVARLTITAPSGLTDVAGSLVIGSFTARVPDNAPYGGKHILDIEELHIYDTQTPPVERPSIDDDAIHVAAFLGDTNGDGWYNSPDATLTRRIIGQVNTGFSILQTVDPVLLADITHNGFIQSNDTTSIRRAIGLVAVPNIPALPTGLPVPPATGADPRVAIPRDLVGAPGETLTVPVVIEVTEPAGVTIGGFDVVLEFDPDRFTVSQAKLGDLFQGTDLVGTWTQPAPGTLVFSADSLVGTSRFPLGTVGDLLTLTVTIAADAAVGPSAFNLLASLSHSRTGVYDADLQELVLDPPLTNAATDLGDGIVTVDDGRTPWHNGANPFDVNGDGLVSPLDALVVINCINAFPEAPTLPSVAAPSAYLDVNNDGACTALDALSVINQLNATAASVAEGEASAGGAPDEVFGNLEAELSPLEAALRDLADDVASAWRLSLTPYPVRAMRAS
jgi:hypothetical protein